MAKATISLLSVFTNIYKMSQGVIDFKFIRKKCSLRPTAR